MVDCLIDVCDRSFDSERGMKNHLSSSHGVSKDMLISELQSLSDELGKTPTYQDMNKYGTFSSKTYQNKFGMWNNALQAANLSINTERDIDPNRLIEEIHLLYKTLDEVPTVEDMEEFGSFSKIPYQEKFGSWNEAIREAGYEPYILYSTGEDNCAWKGGRDDYYGPSWKESRLDALENDDYECQICSLSNDEHLDKYNQELHVHHIERFANYGIESHAKANRDENLVTLCMKCHSEHEGKPKDFFS